MLPVVAIVGRPNVGKSSLFNRIVGRRKAIESAVSGTTRDRVSYRASLHDYEVLLVDTGGLELDSMGDIESDVQSQAQAAIQGADVIVFVLDVRHDPTAADFHAAELLRKSGKPTVLVANKCDHVSRLEERTYNFYELGFGEPVAISAIHGTGVDTLKSSVEEELKKLKFNPNPEEVERAKGLRLAFLGRPNVGKSSFVNAIFGKEKVIVSEIPGTTRDAVEVPFEYNDHPYVLVDTAGIRRRGKVEKGIEKYSVMRSFQSIDDADVVVLVIDANDGVRAQDLHVTEFVLRENKGLIVVMNKMDLFEDQEQARSRLTNLLRKRMAFVPWAPVVFTSALERRNLFPVLEIAHEIGVQRSRELSPQELEFWMEDAVEKHSMAGGKSKRRTKVRGVKQVGKNPPTFVFRTQFSERMHFSYPRYLENSMREKFGFEGTALKLIFTSSGKREGRKDKK
jgi:GTP-binding protein